MDCLGTAFLYARRYSEALALLETVVDQLTKLYGAEHPDTLCCTANLAAAYNGENRHGDAIQLLERVIDPLAKYSGPEYRVTLPCMSNLAEAYIKTDRHSDAIQLLSRVIDVDNHRDLRDSERLGYTLNVAKLATAYSYTDRQNEAIELLEIVVGERTKILGAEHLGTMKAVNELERIRSMQQSDTRNSIA